jgi:hypothetical protein
MRARGCIDVPEALPLPAPHEANTAADNNAPAPCTPRPIHVDGFI